MGRVAGGLGAVGLGLAACTGSATAEVETEPPDLGWVSSVAAEPSLFTALVDGSSREGWIALHATNSPARDSMASGMNSPWPRCSAAQATQALTCSGVRGSLMPGSNARIPSASASSR